MASGSRAARPIVPSICWKRNSLSRRTVSTCCISLSSDCTSSAVCPLTCRRFSSIVLRRRRMPAAFAGSAKGSAVCVGAATLALGSPTSLAGLTPNSPICSAISSSRWSIVRSRVICWRIISVRSAVMRCSSSAIFACSAIRLFSPLACVSPALPAPYGLGTSGANGASITGTSMSGTSTGTSTGALRAGVSCASAILGQTDASPRQVTNTKFFISSTMHQNAGKNRAKSKGRLKRRPSHRNYPELADG